LICAGDNDSRDRAWCRDGARASRPLFAAHLSVVLLLAATPACVIPVAPDFQDPVGSKNSPPYIYASDPFAGSTVSDPNTISVTPADADLTDQLHIRWIADYMTRNQRFIDFDDTPPNNGQERRFPVGPSFDCSQQVVALPSHVIMVVVADQDFAPGALDWTETKGGSTPAIRTWTFVPTTTCGMLQ
jgi:hypothetical protein